MLKFMEKEFIPKPDIMKVQKKMLYLKSKIGEMKRPKS